MLKRIVCCSAILALSACDPLEVGNPPVMSDYEVSRISETQIQVTWRVLATDDILEPEELTYGIWFAEVDDSGSSNLDPEAGPNATTGEGAFSNTLAGLEEDKAYEILVRASDRGSNFSSTGENTVKNVAVGMADPNYYAGEEITSLNERAEQLIGESGTGRIGNRFG